MTDLEKYEQMKNLLSDLQSFSLDLILGFYTVEEFHELYLAVVRFEQDSDEEAYNTATSAILAESNDRLKAGGKILHYDADYNHVP